MSSVHGRVTVAISAIALTSTLLPSSSRATNDIFFSEYVEGSGLFNKALEIYNPTGGAIDTATEPIEILIYPDGATSAASSYYMGSSSGVVLEPGGTLVVVDSNADAELTARADVTFLGLTFDGNDAIMLERAGAVVDVIGQIGVDPGAGGWGAGASSTVDHSLRRMSSVCVGDADASDGFDPALEWEGFALDTFDGLGLHAADCATTAVGVTAWGTLKSTFR